MAKRKSISKKTRFEVFKRDGFRCQYCGACPPGVLLHVDHINPVANGGVNDPDNLVTSCETCNQGKGAKELSAIPESLQSKAARIAEAEEQLLGYQEILRARADRIEDEMWEVAEALWPGSSEKGANRKDLQSIKQFIQRVGVVTVLEMAEVARAAKPYGGSAQWRYFCGCCWRSIRRHEGTEEVAG
jgi:hypothetical protein